MSRSVPEWIASRDDDAIPSRVKLRVFEAARGCCMVCTLSIRGKLLPTYDHKVALINGGEHRESNLQLLCVPCHKVKTRADVAEKATGYRKRTKAVGVRKPSRFPGARASRWKMKIGGGAVLR